MFRKPKPKFRRGEVSLASSVWINLGSDNGTVGQWLCIPFSFRKLFAQRANHAVDTTIHFSLNKINELATLRPIKFVCQNIFGFVYKSSSYFSTMPSTKKVAHKNAYSPPVSEAVLLSVGYQRNGEYGPNTLVGYADYQHMAETVKKASANPIKMLSAYYSLLAKYEKLYAGAIIPEPFMMPGILAAVASTPNYQQALTPMLRGFGPAHRDMGARAEHYGALGDAIMAGLAAVEGPEWTVDREAPWRKSYQVITEAMIDGAKSGEPTMISARVASIHRHGSHIAEIELEPDEHYPFRAGQHANLRVPAFGDVWRLYGIANAPQPDGRIRLNVRQVTENGLSAYLVHALRVGETVNLRQAVGGMLKTLDNDVVCVAGGTGIGLMSAVADRVLTESDRHVTIYYGGRTRSDLYALDKLRQRARHQSRLTLIPMLSRDPSGAAADNIRVGRVPEVALSANQPWDKVDVCFAGSPLMMRTMLVGLLQVGVSPGQLNYDVSVL